MGASVRPREFEPDQPSQTEQLANWISRVRMKKLLCRRSRRRDLRVEAVLTFVLSKAERELRNKQMTRILKWQQLKQRLHDFGGCKHGGVDVIDPIGVGGDAGGGRGAPGPRCGDQDGLYKYDQNGGGVEALTSLDTFMSQLSEIKSTIQR